MVRLSDLPRGARRGRGDEKDLCAIDGLLEPITYTEEAFLCSSARRLSLILQVLALLSARLRGVGGSFQRSGSACFARYLVYDICVETGAKDLRL